MALDEKIAEANRLGMSYGQFKAMLFEKNGYKPEPKPQKQGQENIRRCEVCGIELNPDLRKTIKTCSRSCSYELNRIRTAAYYRSSRKMAESYTKKCKKCGKEFTTAKSNQMYCSSECQAMRYRVRRKNAESH